MEDLEVKKLKILLADDHLIVRQGLQFVIQDSFEDTIISHASSIKQMMIQLTNEKFDLLILDAQFPDGISVTYIHEIKLLQPQIKILVFTSFAEEHFSLKFINAGANGFLNKLSEEQSIKLAIQNVMEQGRHYSSFTEKLLDLSKFNPLLLNPVHHLSERELEIAKLLVNGYGNLEIANTLNIKQNTVSTFKKRIFEKLNINSIIDLIEIIKMI